MNAKKAAAAALLLVWLVLSRPLPTTGQSGIVVTGADSVRSASFSYSSELAARTESVGPRVVSEYAQSIARRLLTQMPTTLQALVNAVYNRVVVEYADSNARHALSGLPGALEALVRAVRDRVVVEYANSTHRSQLNYPSALLNDRQPPQITEGPTVVLTGDTATVSWTTDEFADSEVRYGLRPGTYTETGQDSLYVKGHAITLSGLASETMYYYVVRSTDRSGNAVTSAERSFKTSNPETLVYLPVVLRNR